MRPPTTMCPDAEPATPPRRPPDHRPAARGYPSLHHIEGTVALDEGRRPLPNLWALASASGLASTVTGRAREHLARAIVRARCGRWQHGGRRSTVGGCVSPPSRPT